MIKKARIEDVAKLAGLSTATVSRYINNSAPVSQKNAERIQQAIEDLNYSPHTAAQILASNKTGIIGLLISGVGASFYTILLNGMESRTRDSDYSLVIHAVRSSRKGQYTKRVLGEHNTDGLLVFQDSLGKNELNRLSNLGFPVILVYQSSPEGLDIPSINIENCKGAFLVTEHLILQHGKKRILYLNGPQGQEDSQERERGYRQALEKHGIPVDLDLFETSGFKPLAAKEAVQRVINAGIPFDAVFASDDNSAAAVLSLLQEHKIRVPEDIAVVGFDDQILSRHLIPSLTTVRAPIAEVGFTAVDMLIDLINHQEVKSKVFETEVMVRQSCGCIIPKNPYSLEKRV
ncbi:MAG: LacI family DNA-binding transcriptional regulator [Anaerolineales bacterium]|nr:LacI family DNA-binding transcriptional regulator [Anaerolineales bacterium]